MTTHLLNIMLCFVSLRQDFSKSVFHEILFTSFLLLRPQRLFFLGYWCDFYLFINAKNFVRLQLQVIFFLAGDMVPYHYAEHHQKAFNYSKWKMSVHPDSPKL